MSKSFCLLAVAAACLGLGGCATPARPGDTEVRSADLAACNTGTAIEAARWSPSSSGQPIDPRCRPNDHVELWNPERGRDSEVPDFSGRSGEGEE
ncbi:hypothetical protein [Luteimonas salinilitoris]|uniref:Uncharacterized protein n=1 Tax=Luteimonas salinilitoris TaxID=3237697 RepID=A0ABV4HK01_9GAMM